MKKNGKKESPKKVNAKKESPKKESPKKESPKVEENVVEEATNTSDPVDDLLNDLVEEPKDPEPSEPPSEPEPEPKTAPTPVPEATDDAPGPGDEKKTIESMTEESIGSVEVDLETDATSDVELTKQQKMAAKRAANAGKRKDPPNRMSYTALTDAIAAKSGFPKQQIETVLANFKGIVIENILEETVTLLGPDFGVFKPVKTKERKARNPQTGASITVPAMNKVRFVMGVGLKKKILGEEGAMVVDRPGLTEEQKELRKQKAAAKRQQRKAAEAESGPEPAETTAGPPPVSDDEIDKMLGEAEDALGLLE